MNDHLLKRFTLIKKLDYFIEESVYYRVHSEGLHGSKKSILLNKDKEIGKLLLT